MSILTSLQASEYVESLPQRARQPLGNKLKRASLDGMERLPLSTEQEYLADWLAALEILERLLVWDPTQRLSAEDALVFPYLSRYHDPDDEPASQKEFDWSLVEGDHSIDTLKSLVYVRCLSAIRCGPKCLLTMSRFTEILDHFGTNLEEYNACAWG